MILVAIKRANNLAGVQCFRHIQSNAQPPLQSVKPIDRLNIYLIANATWFLAFGIQMVLFAWLITIELRESPTRVGFAQMALLTPTLLFILIGGSLADRFGGRLLSIIGQSCAAVGPLGLSLVILTDNLSFQAVIVFALWMGTAQAVITPARDGLLSQLAGGQVQKLVIKVNMIQFGTQSFGFLIASQADNLGAAVTLIVQSVVLAFGVVVFLMLKVDETLRPPSDVGFSQQILQSIVEGARTIRATPALATVTLQNLAMGMFMMGSYTVTLPLLIRQNYDGTSAELAGLNIINSIGLLLCNMVLLRMGGVRRPGRALIVSLSMAGLLLAATIFIKSFTLLLVAIFLWGIAGGVLMTMSRTIMQEQAPVDQRGRIMAFFSFSFMGSGLIGALMMGFLVEYFRAEGALLFAAIGVNVAAILVRIFSNIWDFESHWQIEKS